MASLVAKKRSFPDVIALQNPTKTENSPPKCQFVNTNRNKNKLQLTMILS